jgi:hypothetical protein
MGPLAMPNRNGRIGSEDAMNPKDVRHRRTSRAGWLLCVQV